MFWCTPQHHRIYQPGWSHPSCPLCSCCTPSYTLHQVQQSTGCWDPWPKLAQNAHICLDPLTIADTIVKYCVCVCLPNFPVLRNLLCWADVTNDCEAQLFHTPPKWLWSEIQSDPSVACNQYSGVSLDMDGSGFRCQKICLALLHSLCNCWFLTGSSFKLNG